VSASFRASLALLLAAVIGLNGPDVVVRAAEPDPSTVYITTMSYGGSGCPQGSVGQSMSSDRDEFTLIFDQLVASSGPGVPAAESRKSCEVTLNLHAPDGWSFAIVGVEARGYVQAPAGVTATARISYEYDTNVPKPQHATEFSAKVDGPVAKDYLLESSTPRLQIDWSKCDGVNVLQLRSSVQLTGPLGQSAQITIDSLDGEISQGEEVSRQGYRLVWKRCD
jgi:hypothetical protein